MDGVDAARRIDNDFPDTRIIALMMYPRESFVIQMLDAGISDDILEDDAFDELVKAINMVITPETYLYPKAASVLVDHYVRTHFRNIPVNILYN